MSTSSELKSALPQFDAEWNFFDIQATEARFREIEIETRDCGNADYRCQLFTQIARTEGLQNRFEQALNTLDEAEKLNSDLPKAKIRCFLERGRVHHSSGKVDLAKPLFLAAWKLANEASEINCAIDAAHMLGICETPEIGLEWNEKAILMAEQSGDAHTRKWLGTLYNNVAWTYHDMGKHEKAFALFQRALSWREEHGGPRELQIAKWSVARALRSLGRFQEAIEIQLSLEKQLDSKGEKDGYVYEELAELYLVLGDLEQARPYFGRAHLELSLDTWFTQKEPQRIQRLKVMADI